MLQLSPSKTSCVMQTTLSPLNCNLEIWSSLTTSACCMAEKGTVLSRASACFRAATGIGIVSGRAVECFTKCQLKFSSPYPIARGFSNWCSRPLEGPPMPLKGSREDFYNVQDASENTIGIS
ncbi:hypothetical protein GWK47_016256 [Chionoecetes opilio]|uniref:Uncharacterized protein n=1 Tax=Chionoecetes opilio TaxID=41210 RepID=A0A8J5CJR3_CHIOP|nr:hypothetical protein GWK47_016256 [Chionoecetes opilio]